jgi:hypothetical protein
MICGFGWYFALTVNRGCGGWFRAGTIKNLRTKVTPLGVVLS